MDKMTFRRALLRGALLFCAFDSATALAADYVAYDGQCEGGWQVWYSPANCPSGTAPTFGGNGSYLVPVNYPGAGSAVDHQTAMSVAPYLSLDFDVYGGTSGGHKLSVYGVRSDGSKSTVYNMPTALTNNTWTHVSVSMSSMGLANAKDVHHWVIGDPAGSSATPTNFRLTNILFKTKAIPSSVALTVDASMTVASIDPRVGGLNVAAWDGKLADPTSTTVINNAAIGSLRWPGGSTADGYHWSTNRLDTYVNGDPRQGLSGQTYAAPDSLKVFAALNAQRGSKSIVTVNYGNGTPEEAAALVAWANGATSNTTVIGTGWNTIGYWASLRAASPITPDDGLNILRAGHPASYAWKYFEIGNEVYLDVEADFHNTAGQTPHDPVTYGTNAVAFINKMKSVDSSINVGVVVSAGRSQEYQHPDDYCDFVCNAAEAVPSNVAGAGSHYGWTPLVLYTMDHLGVLPSFITFHFYPVFPGMENDLLVLNNSAILPTIYQRLRGYTTHYVAAGAGASIQILEGEANFGGSGRESTSLVNGLFYADHLGMMLTAGFRASDWWAFHNDFYTFGNYGPGLYGTKTYGTEGVASTNSPTGYLALNTLLPAGQVLTQTAPFRASGAVLVKSSSADPALSAYASKQSNGKLTILVVNKDPTTTITGNFTLSGFTPGTGSVTVSTYGKTEDTAGSAPTASSIGAVGTAFNYAFSPYSSTLLTISP